MAEHKQDDAPTPGQDDSAASEGFAAAFAERADQPAGDRPEAGAEPQGSAQELPDEGGSEPAPSNEAAGVEGSGTKAEAFDPFAGMTPELRTHWEKVAASERSQRGRVGALTKKLNAQASAAPSPAPAKPASQEPAEREDKGEATAETLEARLDAVADEYGDVNGPVVEAIKALRSEIAELKPSAKRDAAEVSDAEAEEVAKAYDSLGQKHPDFAQLADNPAFHTEWLGRQPASVVAMANSHDPAEVSLVLTLFKAEQTATKQPGSGEGGTGGTAQGDKRARQLAGSRQPDNRGAPAAAGTPNDFSAGFKARTRQVSA
jgi:hypothetical protein